MGEWMPGQWGWAISYHPELVDPGDMTHLNYEGRAMPPERGKI